MTVRADVPAVDLTQSRRIHFVGIGGIGMSALARVLLARGHAVTGSDRASGDQTDALQRAQVTIQIGHDAANIDGADLVVVTSAVQDDNPEIAAARQRGIPVVKRADVLGEIANAGHSIAVAGTHGKTTTASLIAVILTEYGWDPTALLGGISKDLGSNMRVGQSDLVVVEADEYDATFLRLRPSIGVITNVAAEHLDFYKSEENVIAAFRSFAESVSDCLVTCADDRTLSVLTQSVPARLVTYGLNGGDWTASDIREEGGRLRFKVNHCGRQFEIATTLAGSHNAQNILAAAAVCHEFGVSHECFATAVHAFSGVGRRFDVKGERNGVLVVDDYAVHPTEVRATLAAIRARYERPVRVVFQPHTYSRARDFLDDFARSFGDADCVYVMDVYAARETETLGISADVIASAVTGHNSNTIVTHSRESTVAAVTADARPGDVVVTLGAGDVTSLGPEILAQIRAR